MSGEERYPLRLSDRAAAERLGELGPELWRIEPRDRLKPIDKDDRERSFLCDSDRSGKDRKQRKADHKDAKNR